MSATSAPTAEFQDAGKPVAFPLYLVDVNGNPISSTNALPVNVSLTATSVAIEDGTTPAQKLAVDAGGRIISVIQSVAGTALAADQTNSELRVSTYGKNSAAGDTPFLLNSDGSLQTDLRKIGGTAIGLTNALTVEQMVSLAIRNGQGFSATTGRQVTATNANLTMGMGLWNAANSGKSILLYSIRAGQQASGTSQQLNLTTANPTMGSALTSYNLNTGSATASVTTLSYPGASATASVSIIGNNIHQLFFASNVDNEFLGNGQILLLPAGATGYGVAVYTQVATAGNAYAVTMKWIEF